MGMDCGCNHVWGVLLSVVSEALNDEIIQTARKEAEDSDCVVSEVFEDTEFLDRFIDRIKAVFAESGMLVPDGATLTWTGSGDDRPARCETGTDEIVVGYGMFAQDPTTQFVGLDISDAFKMRANHHNWVWMG